MGVKPINYKTLSNIHGTEVTNADIQLIDRREKYKTILDLANEYGINLFAMNSDNMVPDTTTGGLVTTYLVKERAHQVLSGNDYETHKGVLPELGNERAISFYIGGEQELPAREWDPVADSGKPLSEAIDEVKEDSARGMVLEREKLYMEQAVNSGLLLNSTVEVQNFYDEIYGTGVFTAPASYPNMNANELETFIATVGIYYSNKGEGQMPVMFVSNADWNVLTKSADFSTASDLEVTGVANFRSLKVGMIKDVLIIPFAKLGAQATGDYKGIHRIVVKPGTAELIEQIIRPIDARGANLSRVSGRQTIDAYFISGTKQQAVFFKDNFKNEDGSVESFTTNILISSDNTVTQDPTKVIAGTVHGDKDLEFRTATNRTFSQMVKATYEGDVTGEVDLPEESGSGN